MSNAEVGPLEILTIGFDESLKKNSIFLSSDINFSHQAFSLEQLMEGYRGVNPIAVLINRPPQNVSLTEVAQVARMAYASLPIFLVTGIREGFDRPLYIKNGFTDAFLLPLENDALRSAIEEQLVKSGKSVRAFRAVSLIDLHPEEQLPFETYVHLQRNGKNIKISCPGEPIGSERAERLKKAEMNSVRVRLDQVESFYQYTAEKLRTLQSGTGMSETERKARMTGAIRSLVADLFNDTNKHATSQKGNAIIADCQEIVKKFIIGSQGDHSWYEKILNACQGDHANYSHAGNVSTLAALFSMASGIGKPEDLAMAGLLHDIGMADVPPEVQSKPADLRTLNEKLIYQKHVEHSLNMIRFRKLSLSDAVVKAVAQHHEWWSGVGYPNGLMNVKIAPEAQVLALADTFDELTMNPDPALRVRPSDAIAQIMANQSNPSRQQFDPNLVRAIAAIFPEKAA